MKKALLLLMLFIRIPSGHAQTETYKNVDSTLYAYYRWCNNNIRDSVVLLKADTLFRLAGEKNDIRMQAVALSFKADHYYFNNEPDSLKAWIPRVQAFARANDQPTYYFFTWSRLILYYTKHGQYTLAQYELERYMAQAEQDDYKPAIAEAYKQLGHIYRTRGLKESAADYYRKAIGFIEENNLSKFSLPILYSELAAAPDADDEERQSYIEIIRENSGYLQKLVDDVLYIAGLESSDTPPALGPVDINVCCMQCIQTVRDYSLRKLDIRFEPECAQLPVNTSCLLLSKALTELLRNAARFAPDGRITLAYTLISHKKRIAFTVTDRGPGIPAAEADRIFDRFVKLDPFSQGMGLGLAVCRLIADALGGGVELDTSYTEGARFTLMIPIV